MTERRFYYEEADWGKVIGIVMIVMGHFLAGGTMLKTLFYSIHVPLFFIISGLLFSCAEPWPFLKKRFFRLIVPYALYTVLSLPFYLHNNKGLSVSGLVEQIWYLKGFPTWNEPLWFLPALFTVEVVFCLIWYTFSFCQNRLYKSLKIEEKKPKKSSMKRCAYFGYLWTVMLTVLVVCSFALGLWLERRRTVEFVFGLNKAALMFGFYLSGVLLKRLLSHREWIKLTAVKSLALVILVLGLLAVAVVQKGAALSLLYCDYNGKLWFYFPMALLLSSALLVLFSGVRVPRITLLLSRHTLFIMSTHYFFLKLWQRLFGWSDILDLLGGTATVLVYLAYLAVLEWASLKKVSGRNKGCGEEFS